MRKKILVAYGTKHGSTKGIAEKIGETLTRAGLFTEVLHADNITDTAEYDAIILGSAIYASQWCKEAVKFLKNNKMLLAKRPVWLFSSGPLGKGDAVELLKGWRYPKALKTIIECIKPRDIAIFHGMIDLSNPNFFEKWMFKSAESGGGDFRNWQIITEWATQIAEEMKK